MNKDKAYHQIALACLKALRAPSSSTAEDPAAALYDVIDDAFSRQTALLMAELEDYRRRLDTIAALDPQRHSLTDAQVIARPQKASH